MFYGTLKVPISNDKGLNMEPQEVVQTGEDNPTPAPVAAEGLQLEDPKNAFNDKEIGTMLLAATNWDLAETREGAKGSFKTTGAHSFTITDGQYRYQFSVSINRFHAKQADDTLRLTPQEKRAMKELNLTQAEILSLRERKAKGTVGERAAAHIGSLRG